MSKPITSLVTASGSALGQNVIKSLNLSSIPSRIVCTDVNSHSAGLFRGDSAYLVPPSSDPSFIDRIISVCNTENVDIVFVGTDYELLPLSINKHRIESESNALVVVSSQDKIHIADNKFLTYQFLEANNLPHVPAYLINEDTDYTTIFREHPFPLVIKPCIGDSSRGVHVINSPKELFTVLDSVTNPPKPLNPYLATPSPFMLQPYIPGSEYTSTTLTFDRTCHGVLSMKRRMRYPGHTTHALIDAYPVVDKVMKHVAEIFDPLAFANFQSRLDPITNEPIIFEINCRVSSTTAACALAGFNIVEAVIKHLLFNEPFVLTKRKGLVLKYFNEVFIPSSELNLINKYSRLINPKSHINIL